MWEFVYVTVPLYAGSPDVVMTVALESTHLSNALLDLGCVWVRTKRLYVCVRGVALPLQIISV